MSRKGINTADQTGRSGGGHHWKRPQVNTSKKKVQITKEKTHNKKSCVLCKCLYVRLLSDIIFRKNIFAEQVLTQETEGTCLHLVFVLVYCMFAI